MLTDYKNRAYATIKQAQYNLNCIFNNEKAIKAVHTAVAEGLAKMGLQMVDVKAHKIGGDNWNEGDVFELSIRATPISKKFKFIKFAGYTAKGEGKNRVRLDKKARKMEAELAGLSKYIDNVFVNEFSLETDNDDGKDNVLICVHLKDQTTSKKTRKLVDR